MTKMAPNNQPAFVLVRPQLGENIGKAARAMLNFGLTDLRIVAPRDGWPNPDAGPSAAGADEIIEKAQVFQTTAEALQDCRNVYATTVRKRGLSKPVLDPKKASQEIRRNEFKSAILFGPERSGLETQDISLARTILTIPINPTFGSINLAQAVVLCAYELSIGASLIQPTVSDLEAPATQKDLEGLITHLSTMLKKKGYFMPPDRATATQKTLRNILTKPAWSENEIRTLRGVLSTLERKDRP